MLNRLQPHAAALALAATVTVAILGSVATMANREYRSAAYAQAMLAQSIAQAQQEAPQQIVITGHRVQQIVITGHRRG
jgi:hypothetical protein